MIYTKEINDRQVFSNCNVIQTSEGLWISNPSEEQILEAGWTVYVPPEVEPEPITEPDMDMVMEAVKKMLQEDITELSDEDALAIAALYPTWSSKIGMGVAVGERLWYDEKLYKVIQAHTVQDNWTPDTATSLFVEVSIEEWPQWVQPNGSADAYKIGDKVTYNGKHYVSTIDGNVWDPESYPAGWNEQ